MDYNFKRRLKLNFMTSMESEKGNLFHTAHFPYVILKIGLRSRSDDKVFGTDTKLIRKSIHVHQLLIVVLFSID